MVDSQTPPIEIETGPEPSASVIWLHGLGADGHDFVPIVEELELPACSVRFVFPHAPYRPVTLNNGYVMRAWYDIRGLNEHAPQDVEGIQTAERDLRELMEREHHRGIAFNRLVLAGFSQGGSLALHTGLRFPERLAGILALSTWLPLQDRAKQAANPANRNLPVFMAHGDDDPVVPLALAHRSSTLLGALGLQVTFHRYSMGHTVVPEEIGDIGRWLHGVLS